MNRANLSCVFGEGGFVLTFLIFHFKMTYFSFFLVDYEIKEVQPRMNHFDQSERQLF